MSEQSTALTPYDRIKGMLEKAKPKFHEIAPSHINFDSTFQSVIVAVSQDDKLQKCTPQSVVVSAMHLFELGLSLAPAFGHAYLIARWNKHKNTYECEMMPGYRGLIDLAKRTGEVTNMMAFLRHENDFFEIEYGTDPRIIHKPNLSDPGDVIGAYAVAHSTRGVPQFEYMTIQELDALRDSKAPRNKNNQIVGPWVTDPDEMRRKTVVRRVIKYIPMSKELSIAIQEDNKQYETCEADTQTEEQQDLADRVFHFAAQAVDAEYQDIENYQTEATEQMAKDLTQQPEDELQRKLGF